jgi:hypothetical protein
MNATANRSPFVTTKRPPGYAAAPPPTPPTLWLLRKLVMLPLPLLLDSRRFSVAVDRPVNSHTHGELIMVRACQVAVSSLSAESELGASSAPKAVESSSLVGSARPGRVRMH